MANTLRDDVRFAEVGDVPFRRLFGKDVLIVVDEGDFLRGRRGGGGRRRSGRSVAPFLLLAPVVLLKVVGTSLVAFVDPRGGVAFHGDRRADGGLATNGRVGDAPLPHSHSFGSSCSSYGPRMHLGLQYALPKIRVLGIEGGGRRNEACLAS